VTPASCVACGAEGLRLCYPGASDYITGDQFEVWACPACGSGATVPTPSDPGRYYPTRYREYHPLVARMLELLYRRRVGGWAAKFQRPGAVFEMGCGNGLMLQMLRRRGWRTVGSERTEAAARIARETRGLVVVSGGLDAIDPSARFHLILLNQVLEHLADPAETLGKLAAMLKPGGKLIIGVPNFTSWQSVFAKDRWFHLDVPRHLHHYSLPGLTLLLAGQGLAVEAVSQVSPEHDPYGWVQSVLNLLDRRPNRLTRLLMRLDPPDPVNLLHLALGSVIGIAAIPLALASWAAGRGALIEVTCVRR
jgi:SAM-dependent methyltransferase